MIRLVSELAMDVSRMEITMGKAPIKERIKGVGDAVVDLIPESYTGGADTSGEALRNTGSKLGTQVKSAAVKAKASAQESVKEARVAREQDHRVAEIDAKHRQGQPLTQGDVEYLLSRLR